MSRGEIAPSFEFVTTTGDTLDTDFLHDQVVVLQFAASWCPFSQAQLVDLLYDVWEPNRSNPDFYFLVIGEDLPADTAEFMRQKTERELTMTYTLDANESIYRLFVTPNGSVTRTVIIDKGWRIKELLDVHSRKSLRKIKRTVRQLL